MPFSILLPVLFAAFIHAGWNAVIKGARDKLAITLSVAMGAGIVGVVLLPFLPQPAPASWPYLGLSAALQIGYYLLIAKAYRLADMSLAYPLMRGTAPLLVALASGSLIGESLGSVEAAGVGLISSGILGLALAAPGTGSSRRGIAAALGNAVIIATYTLLDGIGVRQSGSPFAYSLWLAVLTGAVFTVWHLLAGRRSAITTRTLGIGILGGLATTSSYGIALWAMLHAPVALVAALRETSILFALILSSLFLGEKAGAKRLATTLLMLAGVVMLRVA